MIKIAKKQKKPFQREREIYTARYGKPAAYLQYGPTNLKNPKIAKKRKKATKKMQGQYKKGQYPKKAIWKKYKITPHGNMGKIEYASNLQDAMIKIKKNLFHYKIGVLHLKKRNKNQSDYKDHSSYELFINYPSGKAKISKR